MGASDIFMRFYVGDYLADTGDLSTEEHGAYMLLLMNMWRSGGSLDSDAFRLRRMAKVETNDEWSAIWSVLERFFSVLEDGRVSQKRLAEEYRRAAELSEAQAKRGANGGLARARNRLAGAKPTLSRIVASQSQSQSQSQIPQTEPDPDLHAAAGMGGKKAYPPAFESVWSAAGKIGGLGNSLKADAAREWKAVGCPSDGVPEAWGRYIASLPEYQTTPRHFGRWLKARGWEQDWKPAQKAIGPPRDTRVGWARASEQKHKGGGTDHEF